MADLNHRGSLFLRKVVEAVHGSEIKGR